MWAGGTRGERERERGREREAARVPGCPASPRLLMSVSTPPSLPLVRVVVDVLALRRRLLLHAVLGRAPASPLQHLVAAAADLVHPDDVQDVQGDAGRDPGHLGAEAQPVERLRAEGGVDAEPVRRHDGGAHQEERHRHGDAVEHHQAVRARVL